MSSNLVVHTPEASRLMAAGNKETVLGPTEFEGCDEGDTARFLGSLHLVLARKLLFLLNYWCMYFGIIFF